MNFTEMSDSDYDRNIGDIGCFRLMQNYLNYGLIYGIYRYK